MTRILMIWICFLIYCSILLDYALNISFYHKGPQTPYEIKVNDCFGIMRIKLTYATVMPRFSDNKFPRVTISLVYRLQAWAILSPFTNLNGVNLNKIFVWYQPRRIDWEVTSTAPSASVWRQPEEFSIDEQLFVGIYLAF